MVYLKITKKSSKGEIDALNNHLSNKDAKVFILYFMEGCHPCNATRPEWAKLKNVLSNDFLNKSDITIASVDHTLCGQLNNIGSEPNSFPTMRFMTNAGQEIENYEDSDISNKDRTIDSFVEWIKNKTGENNITISEVSPKSKKPSSSKRMRHHPKGSYRHKQLGSKTRKIKGGKWSAKYKKSINCSSPKGFSQRQYCKYGRYGKHKKHT